MHRYKVLLFTMLAGIFVSAYKKPEKKYQKITGAAQGTTYAITFDGKEEVFSKSQADSIFNVIDLSMSLWNRNSTISKFNKSADSQEVDEHFQFVFQKSVEIHQQTGGAFDPSIAPLIKAYGFINKNALPLPSDYQIDSLRQYVGLEKVNLVGNKITKSVAGFQLDFNAIAQGYTVDVLAQFLENKGIQNYLIEVGGEVRAKGKNNKGQFWRIGIEKPFLNETDEQNDLQMILSLKNVSLATSGNYRNYIQTKDKRIGHIIDPKTGKSVEHGVISVSVLAPTCTEADAWATAFTVLGKEKSIELSKKLGFDMQIISLKDSDFEVFQTDGFKKCIQDN